MNTPPTQNPPFPALRSLLLPFLAVLFLTSCRHGFAPSPTAVSLHVTRWVSSTEASPWQEMPTPAPTSTDFSSDHLVTVDLETRFQRIDGFGGCFNELGWDALLALDDTQRATALKALFDPATGCGFTLGRMGMGANDFALEWYSFDETPGDFAMKDFSIARDKTHLIPYMKAAMKYQPNLAVWGTPWSPPTWMKTNGAYKGGRMKQDPQTLAAYAIYFSKYVQAYRAAGINLYAIHPQNEPLYNTGNYPQCAWSGTELDTFLRDYLLPQLKKDKVHVQVWLGTMVSGKLADFTDPVLADPVTGPQITGVGYQYGGQGAIAATHAKYPDKIMLQTETECYKGENTWTQAFTTFGKIATDLNNFANGYEFWNMILNEKSTSTWGWKQNSLLKIDTQKKQIIYNPEFYALKHFSHFVPPGSYRVAATGSPVKNLSAFITPKRELVVVFSNDTDNDLPISLYANARMTTITAPAKSMNTVVLGK